MGDHLHQQQHLDLDPGFRFQPTDEELISFYLNQKVKDRSFCTIAIGEVDINKCEPWELPMKAKMSGPGATEWYFYYHKDRKYPMSHRTNHATKAGFWKITGKDKEIFHRHGLLIGMKKTPVFYMGRAPNGKKTNWVMHEYRIISNNDKMPSYSTNNTITDQSSNSKDEWVVCRIFEKSIGINEVVVSSYPMVPMNNNQIMAPMAMTIRDQQQGFDTNTTPCTQIVQPPSLMDPASSMYHLYDNIGSSSLAPLSTNDNLYFANNQTPPMSLYQHHMQTPTQLGATTDEGFLGIDTWDIVHGVMGPQYHHQ
ncbi:NAC domain-containing protein 92 [Brachypodium distachyon]|uniref:NAC domain-containing protein n=1 Tax=Brachypodium distachyon TaxID=15368 RepID=A0A0Q3KSU2_BRADI|nr:NAC domain-containing protein 92 [Brachypodium distachyon]KQJ83229.1 hypothetical protein BRADI_5g13816v3 [Brachypodium distachyon]|eukprot:XP_003581365.1 NAC domain-containing protein 92 [Brachypodium distachyon]